LWKEREEGEEKSPELCTFIFLSRHGKDPKRKGKGEWKLGQGRRKGKKEKVPSQRPPVPPGAGGGTKKKKRAVRLGVQEGKKGKGGKGKKVKEPICVHSSSFSSGPAGNVLPREKRRKKETLKDTGGEKRKEEGGKGMETGRRIFSYCSGPSWGKEKRKSHARGRVCKKKEKEDDRGGNDTLSFFSFLGTAEKKKKKGVKARDKENERPPFP